MNASRERREDSEWAARQSAYSSAYAKKRKNDGSDFDEKRKAAKRAYYRRLTENPVGQEKVRQQTLKSYYKTKSDPDRAEQYRQSQNKYRKQRKISDPNFALRCALRARLSDLVRRGRTSKKSSALDFVGCSLEELRKHLGTQFQRGMSWANYGQGWHIDHIIPCSKFDLKNLEQQRQCFSYLNLRPCWRKETLRKGNRIEKRAQVPLGIELMAQFRFGLRVRVLPILPGFPKALQIGKPDHVLNRQPV